MYTRLDTTEKAAAFYDNGTLANASHSATNGGTEAPIAKRSFGESRDPFVIDTEEKANWLLAKLANIRAEQERVRSQADQRISELETDYNNLYGRFGQNLEMWAREESTHRRRKTVTLLQGTVAFRSSAATLTISDRETALTTARAVCPEAVTEEAVTRVDRAAFLKKAQEILEATGEIIPGIERIEAREIFSVKVGPSS